MYTVEIFFTYFAIWVKISPLGGGAHKISVQKGSGSGAGSCVNFRKSSGTTTLLRLLYFFTFYDIVQMSRCYSINSRIEDTYEIKIKSYADYSGCSYIDTGWYKLLRHCRRRPLDKL